MVRILKMVPIAVNSLVLLLLTMSDALFVELSPSGAIKMHRQSKNDEGGENDPILGDGPQEILSQVGDDINGMEDVKAQKMFKFTLRGKSGTERVTIKVGSKSRTLMLTTWEQEFEYPLPASGSYTINFLNDDGKKDVYFKSTEPPTSKIVEVKLWKKWKCGNYNEDKARCKHVREGTFAWNGEYTITPIVTVSSSSSLKKADAIDGNTCNTQWTDCEGCKSSGDHCGWPTPKGTQCGNAAQNSNAKCLVICEGRQTCPSEGGTCASGPYKEACPHEGEQQDPGGACTDLMSCLVNCCRRWRGVGWSEPGAPSAIDPHHNSSGLP